MKGIAKRLRGLVQTGDDLVCWEVRDVDSWQPLPVGVSVKLEQVRDISTSVTLAGVSYDLDSMMRISDRAAIRREKMMVKNIGKTSITANIKLSRDDTENTDPPTKKFKSGKSIGVKKDPEEEEEEKSVMKSSPTEYFHRNSKRSFLMSRYIW